MNKENKAMSLKRKVIISGGGTGGHIFPAIAIADALKRRCGETEILFVGAKGRMEMDKVPAAGYEIVGLDIRGFRRGSLLGNLGLPFKLLGALCKSRSILRRFRPDVAVGVGGYASAALMMAATRSHIPTLIQEQNGFAGKTNKLLGGKVSSICVAYEGMERFFPADKIHLTGNPIRREMHPFSQQERRSALDFFGFTPGKKHLFIVGGSLGSRTLNRAMTDWVEAGCPGGEGLEILWQCGRFYKEETDRFMQGRDTGGCRITYSDFIARMDCAYAMADLVVSRSGASSISEICACGKAAIFVPSPNVTEDHQTHNAMALVRKDAALMVRDEDAPRQLMELACKTLGEDDTLERMACNAAQLGRLDAAERIVDEIYRITQ